jgi:1,4-dihydroxy-6-naphthoate synthase
MSRRTLRIGHSPDPDDAFMWYPLANRTSPDGTQLTPKIDTGPYDFVHVLEDIQSLNERSSSTDPQRPLEITALSIHQYPYVADRYALTSCGASMGDGYGPMLVVRADSKLTIADLTGSAADSLNIAIPGERTSAFLALSLLMGRRVPRYQVVMFDQIIAQVAAGNFDAGLIIHEGQLTYADAGLRCVVDLGAWWKETRQLPLPLGGNAIRRDLGPPEKMRQVCAILLASIRHALEHREDSVQYALNYARDMGADLADRFVGMYVNDYTLDYGPAGRAAVNQFLHEAAAAGLVPACGDVDFVTP